MYKIENVRNRKAVLTPTIFAENERRRPPTGDRVSPERQARQYGRDLSFRNVAKLLSTACESCREVGALVAPESEPLRLVVGDPYCR